MLQAPPKAISPLDFAPDNLTDAWKDGTTTAGLVARIRADIELSGKVPPSAEVVERLNEALLEVSPKLELR